jgi:HNH endonuclease
MGKLDVAQVREILDYDPETGRFTWKVNRPRVRSGDLAGYLDAGRYKVRVGGRNYQASRLAFLWMTGEWPQGEVDHKNYNTLDNSWGNLRDATRSENQRNRGVRKDTSTGFKGVRFQRSAHGNRCGYYVAQIGVNGKRVYLGSFKTAEEAAAAYAKAAIEHHGAFARS